MPVWKELFLASAFRWGCDFWFQICWNGSNTRCENGVLCLSEASVLIARKKEGQGVIKTGLVEFLYVLLYLRGV